MTQDSYRDKISLHIQTLPSSNINSAFKLPWTQTCKNSICKVKIILCAFSIAQLLSYFLSPSPKETFLNSSCPSRPCAAHDHFNLLVEKFPVDFEKFHRNFSKTSGNFLGGKKESMREGAREREVRNDNETCTCNRQITTC